MNIDNMIQTAYGHLLTIYPHPEQTQRIFERYALDELGMSPKAASKFSRPVMVQDEKEIESAEFARFYTWYFINVIVPGVSWDTRITEVPHGNYEGILILPMRHDFEKGDDWRETTSRAQATFWAVMLERKDGKKVAAAECTDEDTALRLYRFLKLLHKSWRQK